MNKNNAEKTIKINLGEKTMVDKNIVEMAFLRCCKTEIPIKMEYSWTSKDNTIRGITISGHYIYGVPTLKEYDVYVALQRIFVKKKTKKGICELKTKDFDDNYLNIEFTIQELARELGSESPNSLMRENLKKSLEILLSTTIYSKLGIYDSKKGEYIANCGTGIRLLESNKTDKNSDLINIKLSNFAYSQFCNDYKLIYDKEVYNRTKNLIAKKIFLIGLSSKNEKNVACLSINMLMERICMVNTENKYKKRDIKKALKILNDEKMVKVEYDDKDTDKVFLIF